MVDRQLQPPKVTVATATAVFKPGREGQRLSSRRSIPLARQRRVATCERCCSILVGWLKLARDGGLIRADHQTEFDSSDSERWTPLSDLK